MRPYLPGLQLMLLTQTGVVVSLELAPPSTLPGLGSSPAAQPSYGILIDWWALIVMCLLPGRKYQVAAQGKDFHYLGDRLTCCLQSLLMGQ